MMSSMSVGPSSGVAQSELEGDEIDAPWLDMKKPSIDVHARLHPSVSVAGLPSECNLFDVSSARGVLVAGGDNAFSLHSLDALETLFTTGARSTTSPLPAIRTVPLGERLVWLKFAKDDSVIITSTTSNQIRIFSLESVQSQDSPQPIQSFPPLPSPIKSLQPNPSALPSLVLLLQQQSVSLLDVDSQTESMRLEGAYTAATWSPKGKQVVVGDAHGRLRFFAPDGQEKGAPIDRPSGLAGDYYVNSIHWLENDVFLVTYNLQAPTGSTDPEHSYELYVITRSKVPSPSVTCTHFQDPSPAFGLTDRAGVRYGAFLSSWGGKGNWLGFLGNAPSPLLGVISASAQPEGWKILTLDETSVPSLPLTEASSEDTAVLGMGFDLRTTLPIKRGMVGGEELDDLPPAPRLLVYTTDGVLVGWNVVNSREGVNPYEGMVKSAVGGEISMAGTPARVASPPVAAPAPAPVAFGAFGGTTSTASPFGVAAKPPVPAFGSTTFGQTSAPAFGQSAFGAAAKPPPATSAFSSASFGQSSSFGASAATSTPFGTPTKPAASTGGFGEFASTTPSTTPAPKPAFGAFGGGNPTFGAPATFGAPSAFGSPSTFGAAPKTPVEDKKASPFSGGLNAFSNVSQSPSSPSPNSAPASPSPVSGFGGKPTTTSAFGNAFGSPSSAFGASSTFGTPSTFGASPAAAPKPASPGPAPAPVPTFGSSAGPTAAPAFGSTSSFGSTSTFGAPASGSPFGANKPTFGASTISGPKIAPIAPSKSAFGAFSAGSSAAAASPFGAAASTGGGGFGGLLSSASGESASAPSSSVFGGSGGFAKPPTATTTTKSVFGAGAPLAPSFTAFGAAPSGASPFGAPSTDRPAAQPAKLSFSARITELADDENDDDAEGEQANTDKKKGILDEDDADKLEPTTTSKSTGADLFGSSAGGSFGFGGLGSGSKPASGGDMFGRFGASTAKVEPPTPSPFSFGSVTKAEPEQVADQDANDDEPEEDGEEGTEGSQAGEDESEDPDEQEEPEEDGDGSEEPSESESDGEGDGDEDEDEVEPVEESTESESKSGPIPTIVADGVKIEELPAVEPTEVPLPPSASPSPAPPSPEPTVAASPEDSTAEVKQEQKSTSPTSSPPAASTALAPADEVKPATTTEPVVEPVKTTFGLFGQPVAKPAATPPSTLFGAPAASPTSEPAKTPAGPGPSKAPMFGSKPMFGGKGFPSTAPVRSSPLASPPITRSDELDKSVASPPPSPKPAHKAPAASPFSFGAPPAVEAKQPKSGGLGLGLPSSKPTAPSFGFGAPPAAPSATKTADNSPPPVKPTPPSLGWGAPPPAPSSSKAAPITFGGFGQPKPAASTPSPPLATPSFFGAPAPVAGAEQPKLAAPSFFSAPAAPNKAPSPSPPPNMFGSTTPLSKPPPASSFGFGAPPAAHQQKSVPPPPSFGSAGPTPATPKGSAGLSAPTSGSSTPKVEPPAKPAFPTRTSTSTVSTKASAAPVEVKETGLAGEFLKAYLLLNHEIAELQAAARASAEFQREAGKPSTQSGDLDTQPTWTLGDLPRLKTLAKTKEQDTLSLTDESLAMKRKIAELQSLMLKADTKMEECSRFLRAKDDPDFAKMIKVRQLGPEHTENQLSLRKTTQVVRERVSQMETYVASLKKRIEQDKTGAHPMKAPSLDTIARTMRNITVAVNEKTYEIDDLELRLDVLRLTSKHTGSSTSVGTPSRKQPLPETAHTTSPLRSALNRSAVNPKVAERAARALNDERKSFQVKHALLSARKEPILNRSMADKAAAASSSSRSTGADLLLSRAGPIKFEALPSPRRATAPAPSAVASSSKGTVAQTLAPSATATFGASFPSQPTVTPSSSWGQTSVFPSTPTPLTSAPTFSPLPDEFVPLASGRDFENRRRAKGTAHSSAPKRSPSTNAPPPAPLGSGGFSFGPPPPAPGGAAKTSGMFSFAGLQAPVPVKKTAATPNFFASPAPPQPSASIVVAPGEEVGEGEEDQEDEEGEEDGESEGEFDEDEEWDEGEGEEYSEGSGEEAEGN